ncbi:unnamed protein product, partial [Discosporangium mesarthrocarpum]
MDAKHTFPLLYRFFHVAYAQVDALNSCIKGSQQVRGGPNVAPETLLGGQARGDRLKEQAQTGAVQVCITSALGEDDRSAIEHGQMFTSEGRDWGGRASQGHAGGGWVGHRWGGEGEHRKGMIQARERSEELAKATAARWEEFQSLLKRSRESKARHSTEMKGDGGSERVDGATSPPPSPRGHVKGGSPQRCVPRNPSGQKADAIRVGIKAAEVTLTGPVRSKDWGESNAATVHHGRGGTEDGEDHEHGSSSRGSKPTDHGSHDAGKAGAVPTASSWVGRGAGGGDGARGEVGAVGGAGLGDSGRLSAWAEGELTEVNSRLSGVTDVETSLYEVREDERQSTLAGVEATGGGQGGGQGGEGHSPMSGGTRRRASRAMVAGAHELSFKCERLQGELAVSARAREEAKSEARAALELLEVTQEQLKALQAAQAAQADKAKKAEADAERGASVERRRREEEQEKEREQGVARKERLQWEAEAKQLQAQVEEAAATAAALARSHAAELDEIRLEVEQEKKELEVALVVGEAQCLVERLKAAAHAEKSASQQLRLSEGETRAWVTRLEMELETVSRENASLAAELDSSIALGAEQSREVAGALRLKHRQELADLTARYELEKESVRECAAAEVEERARSAKAAALASQAQKHAAEVSEVQRREEKKREKQVQSVKAKAEAEGVATARDIVRLRELHTKRVEQLEGMLRTEGENLAQARREIAMCKAAQAGDAGEFHRWTEGQRDQSKSLLKEISRIQEAVAQAQGQESEAREREALVCGQLRKVMETARLERAEAAEVRRQLKEALVEAEKARTCQARGARVETQPRPSEPQCDMGYAWPRALWSSTPQWHLLPGKRSYLYSAHGKEKDGEDEHPCNPFLLMLQLRRAVE